jgi:hypothetical protein
MVIRFGSTAEDLLNHLTFAVLPNRASSGLLVAEWAGKNRLALTQDYTAL